MTPSFFRAIIAETAADPFCFIEPAASSSCSSFAVVFKNSISSIHCRGVTPLASDTLQACAQLWTHFNLSLLPLLDG